MLKRSFRVVFLVFPIGVALLHLLGCQTIEIQQQISQLQSVYDQDDAIQALVAIGQPAVDPLIASLDSENDNIRSGAEDALDALGEPSLAQLVTILKNRFGDVRCWAVGKLKDLADVQAVEPLIACLQDNEPIVRAYTAQALGALKDARATEPLIECLKDEDQMVRRDAAYALYQLNDPSAVGPLIAALKDASFADLSTTDGVNALSNVIDALMQSGDEKAITPLIVRLKALIDNYDFRDNAQSDLQKLKKTSKTEAEQVDLLIALNAWDDLEKLGEDAKAIEPIIAHLSDDTYGVRSEIAEILGRLGDARAVEPLITCLSDEDERVCSSAADALGKFHDARAVEPLLARLTDPSPQAHSGVVAALRNLKDVPKTESEQVSLLIALSAWDDLAALGKDAKAVEPLIARLSDDNVDVRSHIAQVLGRLGDARTVEPLISCLKDDQGSVRSSAAKALGTLKDGRAIAPLVVCLKDAEVGVRSDVAGALKALGYAPKSERDKFDFLIAAQSWDDLASLGKLKDASIVDSLITLLSDQDVGIRRGAAFVLGKQGDKRAVDPLIDSLKDENSTVRSRAAEVLGDLKDTRAIQPLVAALPDWDAKFALGAALKKLKWQPKSDEERTYMWICAEDGQALKRGWEKTKKVLLADAQSGEIRKIENAVYAFTSLGKAEVVPDLIRILDAEGNVPMAEVYLNCGNTKLFDAGKAWAERNGYQVYTFPGSGGIGWGTW